MFLPALCRQKQINIKPKFVCVCDRADLDRILESWHCSKMRANVKNYRVFAKTADSICKDIWSGF